MENRRNSERVELTWRESSECKKANFGWNTRYSLMKYGDFGCNFYVLDGMCGTQVRCLRCEHMHRGDEKFDAKSEKEKAPNSSWFSCVYRLLRRPLCQSQRTNFVFVRSFLDADVQYRLRLLNEQGRSLTGVVPNAL